MAIIGISSIHLLKTLIAINMLGTEEADDYSSGIYSVSNGHSLDRLFDVKDLEGPLKD